jgi:hypothetical protein
MEETWPKIDIWALTSTGQEIYAELKKKVDALSPALTYTPWVKIESIHRSDAESNLLNPVCD